MVGEASDAPDPLRQALERALGDRYGIVRLLGRGGMGAVFLARERSLDRLVAVKVLATGSAPDEETRERFRREARVAEGLSHANIVPLHAFGEIEGMLYLVMGFVSGESLRERLKRDLRIPEADARRVLADVAEALDYAHRHNVVHRDVKPDNILIEDETGRAYLADFGIAKGLEGGDELTQAGQVVGTPLYMSPEQAAGREVDSRTDIYSLGAVGFAMLAGRPPFSTKTLQEAILKRHTENAPSLAAHATDAPADLVAAIDRCLARKPDDRFKDARSFRQAVAPDALVEADLPEPLDTLDGKAPYLAALLAALSLAAADVYAHLVEHDYRVAHSQLDSADPLPFLALWALGITLVLQLPILISAARAARRRGFPPAQILGAVFRQPRGWLCLFYPARFRRKDDVWNRLPLPFRCWRILATVVAMTFVAFFAITVVMRIVVVGVAENPRGNALDAIGALGLRPWMVLSVPFTLIACALAAPFILYACARLVRSQGFDTYDLRRVSRTLLVGPTSDKTPWRKPEVAQLLLPPAASAHSLDPQTPAAIHAALAALAGRLDGEARRILEEAASFSRGVTERTSALEREIARRRAELDSSEAGILRERLSKLGANTADDDEHRRQIRAALESQLSLLERSAKRIAEAEAEKARTIASLRALWSAAGRLRGSSDSEAVARVARMVDGKYVKAPHAEEASASSTSVTLDRTPGA